MLYVIHNGNKLTTSFLDKLKDEEDVRVVVNYPVNVSSFTRLMQYIEIITPFYFFSKKSFDANLLLILRNITRNDNVLLFDLCELRYVSTIYKICNSIQIFIWLWNPINSMIKSSVKKYIYVLLLKGYTKVFSFDRNDSNKFKFEFYEQVYNYEYNENKTIGGANMEYVKLGNTGMEVSKLCLGCMGFGEPERGREKWSIGETESREVIKKALESGINFFDTANLYSSGSSEEIVGKALKDFANRDEIVLASKLYFPMFDGPNAKGLSRKSIFAEIDHSLKRLQTDYLDLYIIHRWDYGTPIEETMEALHDLVKMGKVRYIGASSMHAWQFAKAQFIAEKNGWTKFVSMQNLYNLLYREEEREMIPLLQDQKVAMTPWSPLAGGRLTRDIGAITARASQAVQADLPAYIVASDNEVISRVHKLADERGITRGQVATAWMLSKDYVTAPLIGATKVKYLDDALGAFEVALSAEEIKYLEEAYVPRNITGYR